MSTEQNLLVAYADAGQNAKAGELLTDYRKRVPADSPNLAHALSAQGRGLLNAKSFVEAEAPLRECLAIRQKVQPDSWSTFNSESMVGEDLLAQKRYAQAEPLLLSGYQGLKERKGQISLKYRVRLWQAADGLVELYTALDKADDLKKWRAERAQYPAAATQPLR